MKTLILQIFGLIFNIFLVFVIISYSNLNKIEGSFKFWANDVAHVCNCFILYRKIDGSLTFWAIDVAKIYNCDIFDCKIDGSPTF